MTHKEFLESALTAAGSELVKPCTFELCVYWFPVMFSSAYNYILISSGDNDVRAFIDQSVALATISSSTFTGSLQNFNSKVSNYAPNTDRVLMRTVELYHC